MGFNTGLTFCSGSVEVIYLDRNGEGLPRWRMLFWPAPHNFKSKEGAEILVASTAGGLAEQGKRAEEFVAETEGAPPGIK